MINSRMPFLVLFLFAITISFSQSELPNKKWGDFDSLIKVNQPNAARNVLQDILYDGIAKNNTLDIVKSYKNIVLTLAPLERPQRTDWYFMLDSINTSLEEPAKSLTRKILIDQFLFNNLRWFNNQNTIELIISNGDTIDLSTNYDQFLFTKRQLAQLEENLPKLQSFSFHPYCELFDVTTSDSIYFPTLYDYTIHHLIHYHKNYVITDHGIDIKAKEAKAKWYSTPNEFTKQIIPKETITASILHYYQLLEKFHINNLPLLSEMHFRRLNYLDESFNNRDLEQKAWEDGFEYYKNTEERSKFLFELARIKYEAGKRYSFHGNTGVEQDIVEAHKMLTDELNHFPESNYVKLLKRFIEEIEKPSISLQMSTLNYPTDKLPIKIDHQNIQKATIYIFKLPNDLPNNLSLKDLLKNNEIDEVRKQEISLVDKGDFQTRSTEFLMDEIQSPGLYSLLIVPLETNLKKITADDELWRTLPKAQHSFNVSEIFVSTIRKSNGLDFLVTHYKTGKPIEGASISLFQSVSYNEFNKKPYVTGKTNKDGWFFAKSSSSNHIKYTVEWKDSKFSTRDYNYNSPRQDIVQKDVKILTDRAIYRPGQTVYYKIIHFEGKENNFNTLPDKQLNLKVYNSSHQLFFDDRVVTNEFGSASGSFTLPKTGPLGHFRILVDFAGTRTYKSSGSHSFRVEEYKRPTFEVNINDPKKEAKLDDSVTVTGNAIAFAGYPITNANIRYKIYRQKVQRWFYRGYYPQGNNESKDLIIDSTALSNDKGEFDISFFAKSSPNHEPYTRYNFEIVAEVTDISGETHTATLNLMLTKTGLTLTYEGENKLTKDKNAKAVLKVLNMSGKEQEGFSGEVAIFYQEQSSYFQNRLWGDAEFQEFDKAEWEKLFPYAHQSTMNREYPKEKLVATIPYNCGDSIDLNKYLDKQGNYYLRAFATSSKGDTLEFNTELSFIDLKNKELPKPEALWTHLSTSNATVGEKIEFQVGSSFKNAQAHLRIMRGYEVIQENWLDLKTRKTIQYIIEEVDRGDIYFSIVLIYDGRRYSETKQVNVPFDNKKLAITASSFRDKLLPGQDEQWSFTISGNNADEFLAEMCAGMYDVSLDKFAANNWNFWPYRQNQFYANWSDLLQKHTRSSYGQGGWSTNRNLFYHLQQQFDYKSNFNFQTGMFWGGRGDYDDRRMYRSSAPAMEEAEMMVDEIMMKKIDEVAVDADQEEDLKEKINEPSTPDIQIRENFNETAFFYPHLKTNEKNEVVVSFQLPESLTSWKFMALAHTKNLETGSLNLNVVAQKPLMVTANAPRFFRTGDQFNFSSKVVNLTDKKQTLEVNLSFFNPINNQEIDLTGNQEKTKIVTVPANGAQDVSWMLNLSEQSGIVSYKITASNDVFSDGEQKPIPILSNRQFVTESHSFVLTEKGKSDITFEAFKSNNSTTLKNEKYTFEYTANPIWNAILALPYLTEFPYECSEQIFSRYFANQLAREIIRNQPKIKSVFETWRTLGSDVFMSELEKNEGLKSILLEETPWVMNAKNENERRQRLGELFKLNQLAQEQKDALQLLRQKQNSDGGFGWFGGDRSNVYITQHIVAGFGHLKTLGIELSEDDLTIVKEALRFLDNQQLEAFNKLTDKQKENYFISSIAVHWLYASSYYENNSKQKVNTLKSFMHERLQKQWMKLDLQLQAIAGIYFLNEGDTKHSDIILNSLQDRVISMTDKGSFFAENKGGYFWHQDKIGTQALIIEFFSKAKASETEIDQLRLWLMLNKRSNAWESTKSTALATYALLLKGTDYTADDSLPIVKIGNQTLVYEEKNTENNERYVNTTAALGYFQTSWAGKEITNELGNISIEKNSSTPSYGAVYWQYFENMDKVKASTNNDISIQKYYQKVIAGQKGDEFMNDSIFKVGDLINVKLIIKVENDMEFVHLKDLRPAGFEPKLSISKHYWNQGLWYYQSPRDVSMNYFIDRLPRGTYELNYQLFVNSAGEFNGGNATIQCMYAPEFVANSEGLTIKVQQ